MRARPTPASSLLVQHCDQRPVAQRQVSAQKYQTVNKNLCGSVSAASFTNRRLYIRHSKSLGVFVHFLTLLWECSETADGGRWELAL